MAVVKNVIFDLQARTTGAEKSLQGVENKLESLERELEQVKKDQVEYIEISRRMEQANLRLGKSVDDTSHRVNNMSGILSRARTGITQLAAVAGIGIAFDQTIGTIINFDQALADLSAITGATGGDLEFYKEQAREIGRTTTVSASEAVEAFKLIGSAKPELLKNSEALVDLTNKAIILSGASGIELPQAAEQLGLALNALKLPASEAGVVIDVLALAAQNGTREIPYITDALSKFGGVAQQSGTSIQTSVAAIEILGQAIPEASIAGTNMRGILIKLQTAAEANGREFMGLTKELELLKPRLEDITFLKQTFGEENLLAAQTLISEVDALKEFEQGLNGNGAALSQYNTRVNTVQGDISRLKNAWEDAVLEFGNTDSIRGAIQFLTKNLSTIIKLLYQVVKGWIVWKTTALAARGVLWSLAVAQKGYNLLVSTGGSVLGLFSNGLNKATTSFKNLNAAMKANFIGLVVAGLYEILDLLNVFESRAAKLERRLARNKQDTQVGVNISDSIFEAEKQKIQAQQAEELDLYQSHFETLSEKEKQEMIKRGETVEALEKKHQERLLSLVEEELEKRADRLGKAGEEVVTLEGKIQSNIAKIQDLEQNERAKASTHHRILNIKEENKRIEEEYLRGAKTNLSIQEASYDALEKERNQLANSITKTNNVIKKQERDLTDEMLLSAEERRKAAAEERKRQKEAEQKVKEGTIAALEERVSELRKKLTQDLRLDAAEFSDTVEQYVKAQAELEEANKRLLGSLEGGTDLSTIVGLQKEINKLQKLVDEAQIGNDEQLSLNARLHALQKMLKDARKLLEEEDKRAQLEKNLAIEDEEERHNSVMQGLFTDANVNDAEAARMSEEEILKIQRAGEIKQLQLRIEYARRKLQLMYESGEATQEELLRQEHEITEAQQELQNVLNKFDAEDREKRKARREEIIEATRDLYSELTKLANQFLQNQIDILDRQSEAQRKRINDAKEIASSGNAELLELEEQRLNELNKKRERYVKIQKGLAVLEIALNSAVAVTKAANQPFPLNLIAIATTLAALTAGVLQAKSIASQASFYKGGYTGDGNPREESRQLGRKPYTYHKGEFVMDNKVTSIGRNRKIFDKILRGRWDMEKVLSKSGNNAMVINNEIHSDKIVKAIKDQPQTIFNLNKHGVFSIVKKKQNYAKKVDNIR